MVSRQKRTKLRHSIDKRKGTDNCYFFKKGNWYIERISFDKCLGEFKKKKKKKTTQLMNQETRSNNLKKKKE